VDLQRRAERLHLDLRRLGVTDEDRHLRRAPLLRLDLLAE
jgi:hypothetical protein